MKIKQYLFIKLILDTFIILQISCQDVSPVGYYFANLNKIMIYTKTYRSNLQQILRYEISSQHNYEMYENGTFVFTDVGYNYQRVFFNNQNSNSRLKQYNLIDFTIDSWLHWQIHFLVNQSKIITYQRQPDNINQTIEVDMFPLSADSLLRSTNQTFYVITPYGNGTAVINRILRLNNIQQSLVAQLMRNAAPNPQNSSQQINGTYDQNDTYNENITQQINITQSIPLKTRQQIQQQIDAYIQDLQYFPVQTVTQIQGQVRAKACKRIGNKLQYLVLWNSSTYIQIYQCNYTECILNGIVQDFLDNGNLGNNTWVTDNINFGFDCNLFYVQYDAEANASTFDTQANIISNYNVSQVIQQFKTIGGANEQAAIIFPNNTFVVISTKNNTYMRTYQDFGQVNGLSRFHWGRRIVMNYEDRVQIYNFQCWQMVYFQWWHGQCYNCSQKCTSCEESTGYCTSCIQDHELSINQPMTCVPIVIINNTLPQNNITNITNITNIINNTQDLMQIQPPIQPNLVPQQLQEQSLTTKYKYGTIYLYQLMGAQTALEGFEFIGKIIAFVFTILEILPLAWLFLNFMNFWNICSFYVFLNVDIPQYLQIILKMIYDKINNPIFQLQKTAQEIYPLNQKLQDLRGHYGISSSFLVMNVQSLILFVFCVLLTGFIWLLLRYVSQQSWFYKKLQGWFDFKQIVTNQFISYASNYFLPLSLIMSKLTRSSSFYTLNLVLHVTFIGISFTFPFLIFIKTKKKNQKDKQKQKKVKINTLEWIYYSNCNTILPFLCLIGYPQLYLMFGIPFFSFGVWLAFKSENYKLNQTVLALHRLLFHLFFVLTSKFGHFSLSLRHNGSLTCVAILFIGAVHQLLTLFFKIIYLFVNQIRNACQKVQSQQNSKAKQKQINLKHQNVKKNQKQAKFSISATEIQTAVQVPKKPQFHLRKKLELKDIQQILSKKRDKIYKKAQRTTAQKYKTNRQDIKIEQQFQYTFKQVVKAKFRKKVNMHERSMIKTSRIVVETNIQSTIHL